MNKLIGYTTIDLNGEPISLKFGSGAVRRFLKEFGIELHELGTLFNYIKVDQDGVEKELPAPKDPFKFAVTVLWAGADYVNRFNGGGGLPIEYGEELLDCVGGFSSEKMINIYTHFFKAIANGGTPKSEAEKKSPRAKR